MRHSLTIRPLRRPGGRREEGDVSENSEQLLGQVLLSANSSLSRQGAFLFFGVTAAASLLLAGALAVRGYWPILPFAGLELFALGVALGMNMRRGRYRELVSVFGDRIVIEKGVEEVEERIELPRHWTRVELVASPRRGHPSRLLLSCHGKRLEIGAILTEAERVGLRHRLAELVTARAAIGATARAPAAKE